MTSLLPPEFNTVTLVGQYVNLDGSPTAGYLTLTPSPTILRAAQSKDIIVPVTINVPLDGTGNFSIALPATDDPDINPDHWTYTVLEGFGNRRTYSVQILLEAGATQNIFDLAPVAMANGTYYDLGPTGPAGPPALIVSGAPAASAGGTGDYAIDPVAGILYGPKTQASGWGAGTHLAATDIAAHAARATTHGVAGLLVGTTDTQTLSNKILKSPAVTGGLSTDTISATGDIAGHNITGNIVAANEVTVANAPVNANDAVRKDYVDNTAGTSSGTANALMRRDVSNGVSIGSVYLGSAPSGTNHATRKDYVDAADALRVQIGGDLGGTVTAPTVTSGTHHTHTSAQISDATYNATASTVMTRDVSANTSVNLLSLGAQQAVANSATRKDYVDGQIALQQPLSGKGAASGYAALDATSGLLVPGYEDVVELASPPATPAAGHSRLYLNTNHRLVTLDSTGKSRPYASYLGSGTAFPTTLLVVGDIFLRTDIGANGTVYQYSGATALGTSGWIPEGPIVCTSTTRPTTSLFDGLQCYETDTGTGRTYNAASTTWLYSWGNPPTADITLSSGWAVANTASGGSNTIVEKPKCVLDTSGLVHVMGAISNTGSMAVAAYSPWITLPAGFRPSVNITRTVDDQYGTSGAATAMRCDILPSGSTTLYSPSAQGAGLVLWLDWTFRLINT